MRIDEIIRKLDNGKYRLYSKKGKNLGTYDTRSGAEKREQQVQYFKHMNEGYKLQLERDNDMYVLHILDTDTGKRTEVRGKSGYESGNYDADDKLHQLLDKIGKSVDISQLMNGEPVGINPRHPDGEKGKSATDQAFNESVSGEEMLKMFHNMHHDAGMNPDMDEWVRGQEWGIDTIKPNEIVDFEELFDYDDPFDRIIDIDEPHVKSYMAAIEAGRKLDPVILGPKHSDGKYSIVDGNHRALAYAALGKDIPVYMPMGQMDENFSSMSKIQHATTIGELVDAIEPIADELTSDMVKIVLAKGISDNTWRKAYHILKKFIYWGRASEEPISIKSIKKIPNFGKVSADILVDFLQSELSINVMTENFKDGKVKGKSRPGRVKAAGASCKGSVTELRKKAKKYSGERGKMYHWCANMKSGKKK